MTMSRNTMLLGGAVALGAAAYLWLRRTRQLMTVKTLHSKAVVGVAAARHVASEIRKIVDDKGAARIIFATGASQFEFISELVKLPVPWDSVTAFHLDEYVGIGEDHPASFRKYLRERLFSQLKPSCKAVHYLDPADLTTYANLLREADIDLACIGIGENGHIAFNDPPVADFNDPLLVKRVELDDACRKQQLGEGWFPSMAAVPTHAITLTVPAIMRSARISCVVPDERKADAVYNTLHGPLSTACPASILRTHPSCVLWLDAASASRLRAI